MITHLDEIGSDRLFNHYTVGWAHAMNTPYQWTKQIASHWGGTRTGMIVHWPGGIEAEDGIRDQFTHVIDIAPTILEAAGIPEPTSVNGVAQKPIEGTEFNYAFDAPEADETHTTQYFEIMGNRGIYHKGWSACTIHEIPWTLGTSGHPFPEDEWELYGPDDPTQINNLAAEEPERLARMKELFLIEGSKYQVFPLDDRKALRFDAQLVGRPSLLGDRTTLTLYPGMMHLGENTVPDVKNKSHAVVATVTTQTDADSGVIMVQGGRFGGWALYLHQGVPTYVHNWVGLERYFVRGESALPAGDHEIRFEFDYDGDGAGKGGDGRVLVNGEVVGEGRIEKTSGYLYALTDAADVGVDTGSMIVEDFGSDDPHGHFEGTLHHVVIDIDPGAHPDPAGYITASLRRQ